MAPNSKIYHARRLGVEASCISRIRRATISFLGPLTKGARPSVRWRFGGLPLAYSVLCSRTSGGAVSGLRRSRKLVGLGNRQPALGHFGLAVALRAVHHRSAVRLVALAALDLAVLRLVRVELHTARSLHEVVARQVVAGFVSG